MISTRTRTGSVRLASTAPSATTVFAVAASALAVASLWWAPGSAGATVRSGTAALASTAETAMTWWKAAILGVVEGVTEYVPVSSTGHLLITSRLLGLGDTKADQDAANTYAIAIQFGAIVAVAGLFWKRFRDMILGLFGRSEAGRNLLLVTVVAFVPAAVVGVVFNNTIEDHLFGPWPVIAAWVVGGFLILGLERAGLIPRHGQEVPEDHDPLSEITLRQAMVIGLAQVAALWPGTSRSLATILGALLAGVGLAAAVEFSFILGFVTLSAATAFSMLKDGSGLLDQFGTFDPLIGLLCAFASAVVAIKWMIRYLEHNSLAIFGWYRLGVAALGVALIAGGAI